MAKSDRQAAQAVFGSVYGKHKSNSDAQIQREIARLEKQHAGHTPADLPLRAGKGVHIPSSAIDEPNRPRSASDL